MEFIEEYINDLTFFIDTHPTYDGKLIDGIIDYYEKNGSLSKSQYDVLKNVYEKWKVSEYIQNKKYRDLIYYE
ncbi:MAG TPA: hypothetical protein VFD60_04085 [Nitrososphaeraceae archaeon]|nr:hypothetical protein [Nitrososphaeraceae archaeon]